MRVNAVCHERRHGAWSVILARIASALQVVEDLLVNVTEVLPLCNVPTIVPPFFLQPNQIFAVS